MQDSIGGNLRGYRLLEEIGSGGFGTVYRAYQETVGRDVALKIIPPAYANRSHFIRRFEGEAQTIACLEHPYIVPLYDYWRDPSGAYLVMRWLRGGSVHDGLKRQGAFQPKAAARILDQVGAALVTAHHNAIIHRDVKPSNILLDEDGNAYLTDFGLAKKLALTDGGLTDPETVVGTLDYLAPEQARGEAVTPQTDVYSLGVTLYEMLTGQHPFHECSPVERMYKHLNDPLPAIVDLDYGAEAEIDAIIQTATAKNPTRRYHDALDLAEAFRQAIANGEGAGVELLEQLTPRELDILERLTRGLSNQEIAEELVISLATVKWYNQQIYDKLGVSSRVQAGLRARQLKLFGQTEVMPAKAKESSSVTYLPEPENPYKGLNAFQSTDRRDFFGRERLVDQLLEQMRPAEPLFSFLAVVGPSGSGKSSLVRAGLLPAIWEGRLPRSEAWFAVDMVPGTHPLDMLEVGLTKVAVRHADQLHEHLSRDERGLIRAADLILPADGSRLLLIIDQFEEVFTLVEHEPQRRHFLDLLTEAVSDARSRVSIVITLRADYYDRPLRYPAFGELLRQRMITVLPLNVEEMERAIVGPAQRVHVSFDEGLVAQIIAEMSYQAGALPLLQYALTELFEKREGRRLTRTAYERVGGAVGALAHQADAMFSALDERSQSLTRQLFLRLVTLGQGAEDTRRRVQLAELRAITDQSDLMDELIEYFAHRRLLALDHDLATRQPTVELAHEALLRQWERLRGWLDESRADIRLQRQLARSARAWAEASHDPSFLLRGTHLEQYEEWRKLTRLALTQAEQNYLQASLTLRRKQEIAETERQAREARLEQRARRVLQGLVGVFLVAALVSGGLALWANRQRQRAETAEQDALVQASVGLGAQAREALNGTDLELGVLLALEALEHYPHTWQAESALAEAVERYVPSLPASFEGSAGGSRVVWSPDGAQLVLRDNVDGALHLTTLETGTTSAIIRQINGPCITESMVNGMAWSPAGDRLAIAIGPFTPTPDLSCLGLYVYDTGTGERMLEVTGADKGLLDVDWSPNGEALLTAGTDNLAVIRDPVTGHQRLVLSGHTGPVNSARWSPPGDRVATASEDGSARVWDAISGEELLCVESQGGAATDLDWSPDGARLAVSYLDGAVRVWDAATGEALLTFPGHGAAVYAIDWSPRGDQVASLGADGVVRVWDPETGDERQALPVRGQTARQVVDLGWSSAGDRLAVAANTDMWIWDLSKQEVYLRPGFTATIDAQWSPRGSYIVTTSAHDHDFRIYDATGSEIHHVVVPTDSAGIFSWSPDGQHFALGPYSASPAKVWDVVSGMPVKEYSSPRLAHHIVIPAVWSPDGTRIAASSWDLEVTDHPAIVWNVETGETVAVLENQSCHLHRPDWSPDSARLVTGCIFPSDEGRYPDSNTPAFIWDASTGEILGRLESDSGWTYSGEWSPDGMQIVTTHQDGSLRIWDSATRTVVRTLSGLKQDVWDSEWSPAGTRIAAGDEDGNVIIWSAETGEIVLRFNAGGQVLSTHWHPDGNHIIVSGGGIPRPVIRRAWESTEALIADANACCVTRDLTEDERDQFGLPPVDRGEGESGHPSAVPFAVSVVALSLASVGLMVTNHSHNH